MNDIKKSIDKVEEMQKRLNDRIHEKMIAIEEESESILKDATKSVKEKIQNLPMNISSEVEKRTLQSQLAFSKKKEFLKMSAVKALSLVSIFKKSTPSKGKK